MRIAVWHNLPSGGGKRALYNHVKALSRMGHYLEAWTTDILSDCYLPLSDFIIEHRYPFREELEKISKCNNPLRREKETIILLKFFHNIFTPRICRIDKVRLSGQVNGHYKRG